MGGAFTARAEEIGIGELGHDGFDAAASSPGRATTVAAGAGTARFGAGCALAAALGALSIAAAGLAGLLAAGDAGVGRGRRAFGALLAREAGDADDGIAGAAAEEAAAFAFIEDDEFNVIPGGAEFGEGPAKGVVDGFAACFGLIHV